MVMLLLVFYYSVLYYWTLFFPTLGGAAILLIAAMLGSYGGIICCLLFPWLARSIFSQYHRMTTYQRFSQTEFSVWKVARFDCFFCTVNCLLPSFQVAKPDLLGNPHSWFDSFSALLLWKNISQYP